MFSTKNLTRLVVPVLAAMAFHTLVASEVVSSSKSHKGAAKPLKSTEKQIKTLGAKSPITISITTYIRRGNLVISLDDRPVFNEAFEKPVYLIYQTTTWDPLQIPTGKHRLTAKVYSAKGKTYLSGVYDLDVRKNGMELRVKMKGDKLTVEPAS